MKRASVPPFVLTDYRSLRPRTLLTEYRYLLLLLFWPLFGLAFAGFEVLRTEGYVTVYTPLDDLIPFCEFFVFPYLFWFVYLVGMYVYTLLFDVDTFKKYSYFIIITYTVTILIYLFFPTKQELRPTVFERDNILVEFMKGFYAFDTNTNVCPSLHVIGSVAVSAAAWHSKHFSTVGWRIAFTVVTVLITVSTVFLKQHSLVDIPPALVICAAAYWWVYRRRPRRKAAPCTEG